MEPYLRAEVPQVTQRFHKISTRVPQGHKNPTRCCEGWGGAAQGFHTSTKKGSTRLSVAFRKMFTDPAPTIKHALGSWAQLDSRASLCSDVFSRHSSDHATLVRAHSARSADKYVWLISTSSSTRFASVSPSAAQDEYIANTNLPI